MASIWGGDDPLVALKAKGEIGVAAAISGMTDGIVLSDKITAKEVNDLLKAMRTLDHVTLSIRTHRYE